MTKLEVAANKRNKLWEIFDSLATEYRARLLPPSREQFSIERDQSLIAKGSHFFCRGCLSAVPLEEQSRNKGYCNDCYNTVRRALNDKRRSNETSN